MSKLIPLSELPSEHEGLIADIPEPRLAWNFDLPGHVDQDRIMLNADHLRRLQKVASSVYTVVSINPEAEGPEYDATIKGINPDGSAIAGLTRKVREADPSKNNTIYEFSSPYIHDRYGSFIDVHLLNKQAMVQEVVDMKSRHSSSSEEAWATVIDSHLQKSVRQSAKEVLFDRSSHRERFLRSWEYGWFAFVCGNMINDAAQGSAVGASLNAGVIAAVYAMNLSRDTKFNKELIGEGLLEKRRWSLFTESQLDRYVALNALTRVNSLVKVVK